MSSSFVIVEITLATSCSDTNCLDAKEFDPTSLGGDDFLIYGLTSGIKISDRDALIDAWGVFQSGRLPTEDGRKEFRKKTNDSISAEVEKAIGAKTRQEVSSDAAMGEREKKSSSSGDGCA